ncbi:MAG: hypothetical protein AAFR71_06480 [Pseudomonadota bacterium]
MIRFSNFKMMTAAAAVFAFFVSTVLQWYALNKSLEVSREQTSVIIHLSLLERWENNVSFSDIERAIVESEFSYNGKPTADHTGFGWLEINAYLNFFDNLAVYEMNSIVPFEIIDASFGAVITELYLSGQIRDYVNKMRSNGGQERAFANLERLALKTIAVPSNKRHVEEYSVGFTRW